MEKSDITPEHRPSDPLRQVEAREYGRARRRLAVAGWAVDLLALVVLTAIAGRIGGWACVLGLGLGLPLLSLPLRVTGYRLARRHGLSRQKLAGWAADQAKGLVIALVLGGAAAAGLLALQRASETWWPLTAWLAAVGLSALLSVAWPVLLLPIFLKSEPLAEGRLADELWRTAHDTGVRVRELRLLRMGEKTSAANAMVAGLGPTLRIYVSDTLADSAADEAEALAGTRVVLAHELGHHASGDVWRSLAVAAAATGVGMLGARISTGLFAPDGPGDLTTLPSVVLGFSLASAAVSPLAAWYSRRRERAADAYAVRVTGQGEEFARALERLVSQNLGELEPPRLFHALTASHPAPRERIDTARHGRAPT